MTDPAIELAVRGPRVLVQMADQSEYEQASGIITIQAHEPGVIGTVIACGDRVTDVQVNDVVLFPPGAGQEMDFNGERYLVLDEDEVLLIWDHEQESI